MMRLELSPTTDEKKKVKCLVWDLDNTLWEGTLLEGGEGALREGVREIVETLDERGVLQSIASKNDHDHAMEKLAACGLAPYFLHPQINWNAKSESVAEIAERLNIGLEAVALVDDQEFERAEVAFAHPAIRCLDGNDLDGLLDRADMNPVRVTDEAKRRRAMYLSEAERKKAEDVHVGPREDFLATLGMEFSICRAGPEDLDRAEELTVRTNQLNTTGYTYSRAELQRFVAAERHELLVADLKDRFGDYGKIGLALVERDPQVWTIKLLLMSCRIINRGVGTVLINHLAQMALEAGVKLRAEFVKNDRNRMMYITYRLNGFEEVESQGDFSVMERNAADVPPPPDYIRVTSDTQSA